MKMIDFERKGNLIRLYLGDGDDYHGDDWDDTPYNDNASTVYDQYVKATIDYVVPFEYGVYEPSNERDDCGWCKNDMKDGYVPMFIIADADENDWMPFSTIIADKKTRRVYMNEQYDKDDFKDLILIKENYIS